MLVTLTDGLTIAWLVTRDDAAAAATMDFAAEAVANLATPARAPLAPIPNQDAPIPNARTR